MEFRKITNLLDSINNQSSKFRTKRQAELNDSAPGHTPKIAKFKNTMLKTSLCDYRNV